MQRSLKFPFPLVLGSCLLLACPTEPEPPKDRWEVVFSALPGALLSVWGTNSTDVWAVGGDGLDGRGPTVIHFDGDSWSQLSTGEDQGNLWWVFGFEQGPVYMGGDGGVILRYDLAGGEGTFTKMSTPGTGTVFGIWGATPSEVWAVGGDSEAVGGFAWRLEGDEWTPEPSLPAEVPANAALWKVFGTSTDDAWFVGSNGVSLHWDGTSFTAGDTGVGASLFTVHESEGRYAAVGGTASGFIVEYEAGAWTNVTPDPPPQGLSGVTLGEAGFGIAVGQFGSVYSRSADAGWKEVNLPFNVGASLHGSWIDEQGGVWVVGGQVYSPPLNDGVLLHWGSPIPTDGL
ncbi:MAG: hypothetical protein R6X02_14750 [Enhygromyxa sp.]